MINCNSIFIFEQWNTKRKTNKPILLKTGLKTNTQDLPQLEEVAAEETTRIVVVQEEVTPSQRTRTTETTEEAVEVETEEVVVGLTSHAKTRELERKEDPNTTKTHGNTSTEMRRDLCMNQRPLD